jgi:hypothetical protein
VRRAGFRAEGRGFGSGGLPLSMAPEYYRGPVKAPVAQLDRVLPSEEVKQRFEAGGFS